MTSLYRGFNVQNYVQIRHGRSTLLHAGVVSVTLRGRAITDAAVQLIQVSDVTIRDVQICKMRWLVILAEIVIVLQKSARWQRKLYIRKLINMTLVPCNSCT